MLSDEDFTYFKKTINFIGRVINGYIKSIGKYPENDSNKLEDSKVEYHISDDKIFPIE